MVIELMDFTCALVVQMDAWHRVPGSIACLLHEKVSPCKQIALLDKYLRLRGAGEMLGTQQAGLPLFRIADLAAHGDLLAAARDDAALILARDAELKSERGEALRTLLYLFERDEAVKLLSAG